MKEGSISLRLKLKQPTKEVKFESNVPLEYSLGRIGETVYIRLRNPIIGPRKIIKSTWDEPEEDSI